MGQKLDRLILAENSDFIAQFEINEIPPLTGMKARELAVVRTRGDHRVTSVLLGREQLRTLRDWLTEFLND